VTHPRRSRSVSIGPQSAADAHEALALRREMRLEKQTSGGAATGVDRKGFREQPLPEEPKMESKAVSFPTALPTPSSSSNDLLNTAALDAKVTRPLTPDDTSDGRPSLSRTPSQDRRMNEKDERELFSMLEKPRVRYDVEVVTKLIVYGGKYQAFLFVTPLIVPRYRIFSSWRMSNSFSVNRLGCIWCSTIIIPTCTCAHTKQ
jgi:dihydrosphingosine 1-phosphate phosphatase